MQKKNRSGRPCWPSPGTAKKNTHPPIDTMPRLQCLFSYQIGLGLVDPSCSRRAGRVCALPRRSTNQRVDTPFLDRGNTGSPLKIKNMTRMLATYGNNGSRSCNIVSAAYFHMSSNVRETSRGNQSPPIRFFPQHISHFCPLFPLLVFVFIIRWHLVELMCG